MDNLAVALEYAERGWPVFPLHSIQRGGACSCGTRCDLKRMAPGKHPRTQHGFQDATTDAKQIRDWWTGWPDANIGITTGEASGLWVLDVDNKRSVDIGGGNLLPEGEHSLRILENEFGALPSTLTQQTGSGGSHYLFRYPSGGRDFRNRNHFRPGLDIRAAGGYIIVPPSNHESGFNYRWNNWGVRIVDPPEWLLQVATTAPKGEGLSWTPGTVIPKGNRNRKLFELGSRYRGLYCFEYPQIFALLMGHNMNDTEEPLDHGEIEQLARNAAALKCNLPDPEWVTQSDEIEPEETEIDPGADLALSLHELMTMQIDPPTPIVHNLIDGGSGIIVAGPPNVGKSWLALDMALAVATGGKFLDEFDTTPGAVLIVDEEGTEWGDQSRFDMLLEGRGIGSSADIPIHLAIGKGYKLDTEKGLTAVRRMIERYKPSLVVIDSLIRVHSADENVSKEMAKFFAITTRLMASTGASFLFVHHVRKIGPLDQGIDPGELIRGSSDIRAWPSIGFVVLPGSDGMVEVHNIKQRWRSKHPVFNVRILVSSDGKSATLGYMGKVESKSVSTASMQARVLDIVKEIADQGDEPTAALVSFRMGKSLNVATAQLKRLVAGGILTQMPIKRTDGQRGTLPMAFYPKPDDTETRPE